MKLYGESGSQHPFVSFFPPSSAYKSAARKWPDTPFLTSRVMLVRRVSR